MASPQKSRLFLVLAAGFLFLVLFLVKVQNEMHDFQVNYTAGYRLGQGETIYRPWKPDPGWENDGHWQFKYSPFSALIYLPLSRLPLPAAKGVWFFFIIISISALASFSSKADACSPGPAGWAVIAAFLILGKFFLRELQLGQINAIIAAILMGMTALLVKNENGEDAGRDISAGLLWGLAAALKPYAVIFLPYFALKKRWRTLAAGTVAAVISLFLPAAFYGFQGNIAVLREWLSSLSESTPVLLTSQDNVSLLAAFSKWTGQPKLAPVLFGTAAAVLAVLTLIFILRGKNAPGSVFPECALLLLLIPLLSPLGWDYTFLAAFPAVIIVFRRFAGYSKAWQILLVIDFAVIALSLYDLLGRRNYSQFMAWSVPTVNFLVLAAAVFLLRFKRSG